MNLAPCTNPSCPLCVDNGLLKGGELYAVGEHWYIYIFFDEGGNFQNAMINPKQHYAHVDELPSGAGDEYLELYGRLRKTYLTGVPYNLYENAGYMAGQRILDHAHNHVFVRHEGTASSNMGLALLARSFDALVADILVLATECVDPGMRTRLHSLASKYVVKP